MSHPLIVDSGSKTPKYYLEWMQANQVGLRNFTATAAIHRQDLLIKEILLNSKKGRNAGWPDLVLWTENKIIFAEVKHLDILSAFQLRWIESHSSEYGIEILKVKERPPETLQHLNF